MATKTLTLANIGWPTFYIRKEPVLSHVADLRDVIKAKDNKKEYPFDEPIMVRKLAKPAAYKVTLGGKAGTCEYELVKGLHRSLALQLEHVPTVLAEVVEYTPRQIESGDALFAQYDDHQVQKLTIEERALFIKVLRAAPYKWTVEDVAKKMGISTASVSRIQRGLQATGAKAPRKKRSASKKDGAEGGASESEAFVAAEWYEIMTEMVNAFNAHAEEVENLALSADPKLYDEVVAIGQRLQKFCTDHAGAVVTPAEN